MRESHEGGLREAFAVTAGITTSLFLETLLLHLGRDGMPWRPAFRTTAGMSLLSMVAMESVENLVDFHLTAGVVAVDDPKFWAAAAVSVAAGFAAPLPYNYVRLRMYEKGCH
jgi:Domain of unknown function (DUF4396)